MSLKELVDKLKTLVQLHPEAEDAEVWAGKGNQSLHIKYVGFNKRHKPARVKLEE